MAKKKATKVPDGISYKKTATGINVTIADNGRILATMRGYNNPANMQKGLHGLRRVLNVAAGLTNTTPAPVGKFAVTDRTPKKKK